MPQVSELKLAELTGFDRGTVKRRLDGMAHQPGPRRGRLYDSKLALERLYRGDSSGEDGEIISKPEAERQLTIARKEQIDLEMEVTRRDRIPLAAIRELNERGHSNVAGMLKAHAGKVLTEGAIQDMLGELRAIGDELANGPG